MGLNKNKKNFSLGTWNFQIRYPNNFRFNENFLKFETDHNRLEYYYDIYIVETLPECGTEIVENNPYITVFKNGIYEQRILCWPDTKEPYACYQETGDFHADIYILKNMLDGLKYDNVFCSLFAFESKLLKKNLMILHCSYIVFDGQAILFSGPSGVGKSTQAGLWQKYCDALIVNGDRALIGYNENTNEWTVYGWPVCGDSDICENKTYPLAAIVFLSQGKTNGLNLLSLSKKFQVVYEQFTINYWNRVMTECGIKFIEKIINSKPIYMFSCTADESAVRYLLDKLTL